MADGGVFQTAEIVSQSLIGVGAVLIALVSFRNARNEARFTAWQNYLEAWGDAKRLPIEHAELRGLIAARRMPDRPEDVLQVESYIFLYLNIADLAVHAFEAGAISRKHLDAELRIAWDELAGFRSRAMSMLESPCFSPLITQAFSAFDESTPDAQP